MKIANPAAIAATTVNSKEIAIITFSTIALTTLASVR